MREIIEELLTTDTPWECFKENYYSAQDIRLFCFDNEINNFGMDFTSKQIDKYIVHSFSSLENTLVIDKYNFESYFRKIKVHRCFDFDSNIISYLRKYLVYKQIDPSFKELLVYLKSSGAQISCSPYILEAGANRHDVDTEFIFESVVSFFAFDKAQSIEEFDSYSFDTIKNDSEIVKNVSRVMQAIKVDIPLLNLPQYHLIYCLLLKIYEINFKSKKSAKNKMLELLECVNKELFAYTENELYIAYLFFNKDERISSFFDGIKETSSNVISKINAMAWDLLHLRNLETQVASRNSGSKDVFLHFFCSRDFGINNILNLNPIKRLVIVNERCYPIRENNITNLEFSKQIIESLVTYKQHRAENREKANLKKVSEKYEKSLMEVLEK
ncbi:hypothetical protein KM914_14700 [Virgibacillus pantothenticus]|uniref:hypothetical protein n=1 Tax=Virgibacillus pantothenticus TaxID=1473 RepID=UPI001C23CBB1|nr:hypothetical protein [Virgibacillus pantothenticus]MBU8567665.1 hypothetical protein [Virgibacillus pantothenticus]MBU8602306.1 hypothetical protein [Virgibacillus pantothenticus]MBU8635692.1 hypothetical protein [Virgibacillus pantothenticus]MBU8644256.1 hypothetical protein [Virgibacillus pantothenticus]MBU8666191.1 hypothetical protein [Virgibacillus pantothenticus]